MDDSKDLGPANHSVELTLPNELGYERVAMACSASLARIHGFPAERIEDLKTVVAEAAINAMQHGNQGRPDAHVKVRIEVVGDAIQVAVADEGCGITEVVPEPDIERVIEEQKPAVGFGLFLMRHLTDRIEFSRMRGGGHVVRMDIRMNVGAGQRRSGNQAAAGQPG